MRTRLRANSARRRIAAAVIAAASLTLPLMLAAQRPPQELAISPVEQPGRRSAPADATQRSQQLSYPQGTTNWVLQYLLALGSGLLFLLALNAIVSKRNNRESSGSLAKEAAKLNRLAIGYPEGMTIFEELRQQQLLEDRLTPLGVTITWTSYPSASTLLTDLSRGSIDFCGGGGTASIFSQAAEHLFVRVAREKYPDLQGEAILVHDDSAIHDLADLRGKRVAVDEGSSAHYVLIRALQKAGIGYHEITPILLPQNEALPLFQRHELDAWVVWMPYAPTQSRRLYPGRSIADLHSILGQEASSAVPTLYYAIPELVRDFPRTLKAILEELNEAGVIMNQRLLQQAEDQASQHPQKEEQLASLRQRSLERALLPLDDPTLSQLQHQANVLHELGLVGHRVNVRDGSYSLRLRQNWTC